MKPKELCRICNSEISYLFDGKIMNKYNISYYKCNSCGFIQTESPYWLEEAYNNVIAHTDVGLLNRNLLFRDILSKMILKYFNPDRKFLDYAGGYGIFTRLMRDNGFDFYSYDKYCENIFARNFELKELDHQDNFELITAFEYLEHIVDPVNEIKTLFKYSDALLFSTEIQPDYGLNNINDWWYFAPETGQHISFYTKQTFEYMADSFNCNLYTNGSNLHMLILNSRTLKNNPFHDTNKNIFRKLARKLVILMDNSGNRVYDKPKSKLQDDFFSSQDQTKRDQNSQYPE